MNELPPKDNRSGYWLAFIRNALNHDAPAAWVASALTQLPDQKVNLMEGTKGVEIPEETFYELYSGVEVKKLVTADENTIINTKLAEKGIIFLKEQLENEGSDLNKLLSKLPKKKREGVKKFGTDMITDAFRVLTTESQESEKMLN